VSDSSDTLIAALQEQERRLVLDRFDENDAWVLGCLLVELARSRDLPVTIDVRRGGHQLFHAARPGTTPDNDRWVERKARVVERFGASSYLVGRRLAAQGRTLDSDAGLEPALHAAHGGSSRFGWPASGWSGP